MDHQHPHDFFMNLSATWRLPLGHSGRGAVWLQGALRGEPALGPTTFMHRASAGENPTAILGHHFQDSTHITDDVVTRVWAMAASPWKARPSTARSPTKGAGTSTRVASTRGRPGSRCGWAAAGRARCPTGSSRARGPEPGDVKRTTASLHYGEKGDRPLAVSFVWGRNRESHGNFNGFLLEGAWQATTVDHFYARAEQADRDLDLLVFKGGPPCRGPRRSARKAPRRPRSTAASRCAR